MSIINYIIISGDERVHTSVKEGGGKEFKVQLNIIST